MVKMLIHVCQTALALHDCLGKASIGSNLLKVTQTRRIPRIEVTG